MVTPARSLVLASSSGSLALTQDEKGVGGWCQAHLIVSGASRPLGAERLKYIATHLSAFLADAAPGVRWVFSLSELHTSAYGEHVGGKAVLHLQDADGKAFATLVLTQTEKNEWRDTLVQHMGT